MELPTILAISIPIAIAVIAGVIIGVLFATGVLGSKKRKITPVPAPVKPTFAPNDNPPSQPNFLFITREKIQGISQIEVANQIAFSGTAFKGLVGYFNQGQRSLNAFSVDLNNRKITIEEEIEDFKGVQGLHFGVTNSNPNYQILSQRTSNIFTRYLQYVTPVQDIITKESLQGYVQGCFNDTATLNPSNVLYIVTYGNLNSQIFVWKYDFGDDKYTEIQQIDTLGNRSNSLGVSGIGNRIAFCSQNEENRQWELNVYDWVSADEKFVEKTKIAIPTTSISSGFGCYIDNNGSKFIVVLHDISTDSKIFTFAFSGENLVQTDEFNFGQNFSTLSPNISTLPDLRMFAVQVLDSAEMTYKTLVYRLNQFFEVVQATQGPTLGIGDPAFIPCKAKNLTLPSLVYENNNTKSNILLMTSDDYQALSLYKMTP